MYQALHGFSVLQATESWVGPGNEASFVVSAYMFVCVRMEVLTLLPFRQFFDYLQYAKTKGIGL